MTEFKLPELGENIEQGDLVRLMIAPGADIKEGQPVMELETDKAVIEVPSSVSGVVSEIRVKEGDKLKGRTSHLHGRERTGAKARNRPRRMRQGERNNRWRAGVTPARQRRPSTNIKTRLSQEEARTRREHRSG